MTDSVAEREPVCSLVCNPAGRPGQREVRTPGLGRRRAAVAGFRQRAALRLLSAALALPVAVHAGGEVTSISTHEQNTSASEYSVDGQSYRWGVGREQVLDSFVSEAKSFYPLIDADRVEIVRVDRPGSSSGTPCSVFAERGENFTRLQPSFPGDGRGEGNCDMARMLRGDVVNRGALNVFSNIGDDRKNIERVDFIFDSGISAPLQSQWMDRAGHLVSEKRGNNPIQIAAILELDIFGQPLRYGPLIRVQGIGCQADEMCYGETPLTHNYSFFSSNPVPPNGAPAYMQDSTETVAMGFVSLQRLGLVAGQQYFGFSYFPKDVDPAVHSLTDPAGFPADTADSDYPGDGADIYGGMSSLYVADQPAAGSGSIVTVSVFVDTSGDGIKDDFEAGVEDIEVILYNDIDGNGEFDPAIDTATGDAASTDAGGQVFFIGVPDGPYLVVLDENDPDLPPGIELPPGAGVVFVQVPQAEGESVNFAFTDSGSTTDGTTTDGTTTDGTSTDGTTTDGTSTDGTSTDGTSTDGTSTDGTSTDGTTTDGTTTDGTSTDGTSTDGTSTDGTSTDGTTTDGTTTDGTTTDGTTTDGTTTDGTSTDGTTTDGTTTDGTSTDGTSTDGTSTDGTSTDGTTTDGTTTDGTTTDGTTTDGTTTDGTTTDGTTTDGTTTDGTTTDGTTTDGTTTDGTTTDGTTTDGTTTGGSPLPPVDDPTLPVATNDSVTAQQNMAVTIDALANDIDPAQAGLTIVEVSAVENGSASIVNQQIVFVPALGFLGTTAFSYTIEDANSQQDSGTISVTVVRFSDINNDGINDYDQCAGCTSLDLITGVHGSGLGSLSAVLLALLLGVAGLRLRGTVEVSR